LRPQSLRLLKLTIDTFAAGREGRAAAEITTQEIAQWLASREDWGQWRRRGAIIDVNNLFRWAVRAGLLVRNPVDGIEPPKIDHGTPTVLAVERAKALLKLCRAEHPKCLPWLVLGLFAGLRSAEIERLTWDDIGKEHITLASHQTKGRARRLVKIRPTLAAWMKICKRKKGKRVCSPSTSGRNQLRTAFGGLEKNILRHSFISYELAQSKDVQATALEAGNSAEIIFRHYREIVTPEQAKAFWDLLP
jgi:integrase